MVHGRNGWGFASVYGLFSTRIIIRPLAFCGSLDIAPLAFPRQESLTADGGPIWKIAYCFQEDYPSFPLNINKLATFDSYLKRSLQRRERMLFVAEPRLLHWLKSHCSTPCVFQSSKPTSVPCFFSCASFSFSVRMTQHPLHILCFSSFLPSSCCSFSLSFVFSSFSDDG